MTEPQTLQKLAATLRGISAWCAANVKAEVQEAATALDTLARIQSTDPGTQEIEREHERVQQTYDSQGLSGSEANEAHRNRAFLLDAGRTLRMQIEVLRAELAQAQALNKKGVCIYCDEIVERSAMRGHAATCTKRTPSDVDQRAIESFQMRQEAQKILDAAEAVLFQERKAQLFWLVWDYGRERSSDCKFIESRRLFTDIEKAKAHATSLGFRMTMPDKANTESLFIQHPVDVRVLCLAAD